MEAGGWGSLDSALFLVELQSLVKNFPKREKVWGDEEMLMRSWSGSFSMSWNEIFEHRVMSWLWRSSRLTTSRYASISTRPTAKFTSTVLMGVCCVYHSIAQRIQCTMNETIIRTCHAIENKLINVETSAKRLIVYTSRGYQRRLPAQICFRGWRSSLCMFANIRFQFLFKNSQPNILYKRSLLISFLYT
jgi:hypothetical protein